MISRSKPANFENLDYNQLTVNQERSQLKIYKKGHVKVEIFYCARAKLSSPKNKQLMSWIAENKQKPVRKK